MSKPHLHRKFGLWRVNAAYPALSDQDGWALYDLAHRFAIHLNAIRHRSSAV